MKKPDGIQFCEKLKELGDYDMHHGYSYIPWLSKVQCDIQHADFAYKNVIPARVQISIYSYFIRLRFHNLDRRIYRIYKYKDFSDMHELAFTIHNIIPELLHKHLKDYTGQIKQRDNREKKIRQTDNQMNKILGDMTVSDIKMLSIKI
jgi:hypothetical protein